MDHSKKTTYLFSIDALRVIAILAVLLIHSTTKTLQTLDHNVLIAPLSLFLNQASRFAVPLFFLISGFVLELNNREGLSYITFFKKRASRIIIPFLFWSTIYFLIGNGFNFGNLFSLRFLKDIFYGTASYHLYFIPTLILFYLSFPFLHSIIKIIKNPFVLCCIVILQTALQFKDYYFSQLPIQEDLRIATLSISMFILGMVASHHKENIFEFIKKYFIFSVLSLFSLSVIIFFHVKNLTLIKHTSGYIYNQYSPLNYLYTALIASVLFYTLEKTQFLRKIFITFSKLSFFVFFIHVLILETIWNNLVTFYIKTYGKQILTNILFDPLVFLIVACISFTIAYLVHKIPNVYKITG